MHIERVEVVRRKVDAQDAELALAERDVSQMSAELKAVLAGTDSRGAGSLGSAIEGGRGRSEWIGGERGASPGDRRDGPGAGACGPRGGRCAPARRVETTNGEVVITRSWVFWAASPVSLAGSGSAARGQDTTSVACVGQRIDDIVVRTSAPTVAILRHVPVLARAAAAVHTTTHPQLIRRFLLLRLGDRCDELRRAESERILRAQPFIAEASVHRAPEFRRRRDLDVATSDEVALVLESRRWPRNPPVRFFRRRRRRI